MNRSLQLAGWVFCLALFFALTACGGGGGGGSGGGGGGGGGGGSVAVISQQQAYIKASNTGEFNAFGFSTALSADGNTLAVGALGESSAATGIGGDQAQNPAFTNAGAVYVFTRSGTTWTQQAYIKASNTNAGDEFGTSVALSSDGSTLVVGARRESSAATGIGGGQAQNPAFTNAGAAYVFTRSGTTWMQQAYVKASNTSAGDEFGASVALSSDGNTLVVGASAESSAATGIGGDQAHNPAFTNAGAVYVFTRSGTTWAQQAYVKASNARGDSEFGGAVALSSDGSTLVVGASAESSAATGIGGDQADDMALNAGAAYVFTRSGTTWTQQAYIKGSNTAAGDIFGVAVALSGDGNVLVAGAAGETSAATGIGGDQAHNPAFTNAGAVYVFTRSGTTWTQQAYVKASNTGRDNLFGFPVAVSSDSHTIAVGAFAEQSAATGIDGNQADDSALFAGAVYVFH